MSYNRFKKLMNLETKNYLRFAIVEVILVVAGILIALQVNNWNEKRKEKVEEKKILLSLHNEISNNLINLQVVIDEKNKIIDVEIIVNEIQLEEDKKYLSIMINDITEKKQFEDKLTKAIINTQEEERFDIGSELHDCLLYTSPSPRDS